MPEYSKTDTALGDRYESRIQPTLEGIFGRLTRRSETDRYDAFDFSNDRVYIETKCRRVDKDWYPTTMVGEDKVLKGLQLMLQGYKVYFVFGFRDGDFIWELNRDQYEVSYSGRTDRGKPEIKSYCFVPVKYLTNLIDYATQEAQCLGLTSDRVSQETPQDVAGRSDEGSVQDVSQEGAFQEAQVTP